MAAAFDDQERMASLSMRSIINVPVALRAGGLAVLNFGLGVERIMPGDVTTARTLGVAASAGFALDPLPVAVGDAVKPSGARSAARRTAATPPASRG